MFQKKNLFFTLIFLFVAFNALACTIFTLSSNGKVLVGNNEDWTDQDSWIWFLPGKESEYGMVLTGFGNAYAQGGMNEKGLFFDWFAWGEKLTPVDSTKELYNGNLSEKILADCCQFPH